MTDQFMGLVPETPEQRAERLSRQIPLPVCAGKEVAEKLWDEPPQWNRVEFQSRTNMCAAHAGTTVVEVCCFQKTGAMIQRSRNYLYARAQQICGLFGDQGVTLGSIIEALQKHGVPPEESMPFNGTVNVRIPAGCDDEAAKCKVTATIDVHTQRYNAVRTIIGQNMGAVLMATEWPMRYSNGYIVEHYSTAGSFGHARAWIALSSKLDRSQRPYVWCANSHGTDSQYHGYELWSPDAINEHLSGDQWGSTGVTGLSVIEPREVDWAGADNPFLK